MAHRVTLRRPQFERRARALGLTSQAMQAREIGVHGSIHSRALQGKRELSAPYVLGVLKLLGDDTLKAQIDDLFQIEAEVDQPEQRPT